MLQRLTGSTRLWAVVLTGLVLAIAGVAALDAHRAIGRHWLGVGLLPNAMVAVDMTGAEPGEVDADLRFQDRITTVDGVAVDGAADLDRFLATRPVASTVRLGLERDPGRFLDVEARVRAFTSADYWRFFGPLFIGGLLGLGLGIAPLLARPTETVPRAWFRFNLGMSCNFGILALDWFLVHRFTPWGLVFGALAGGGLIHMGLALPRPLPILERWPRGSIRAAYAVSAVGFAIWASALVLRPGLLRRADWVEVGVFVLGAMLLLGNVLRVAFGGATRLARRQARLLLASLGLFLAPGLLFFSSLWAPERFRIPPVLYLLPVWASGISIVWGMLRANVFELDAVARRTATWALALLGSILIGGGLALALRPFVLPGSTWAIGSTAAALLVAALTGLPTLREPLEGFIARTLFPDHERARRAVHGASRELARLREPSEVASLLQDAVNDAVGPAPARLFAGEPGRALVEIVAAPGGTAAPPPAIEIAPGNPLHQLARDRRSFALDLGSSRARALVGAMGDLDARIAVGLPPGGRSNGLLLVGRRGDGRLYTSDHVMLIETLAAQLVVALENARAWSVVRELERKLAQENHYLREELASEYADDAIVGRSPALRSVLAQIERVAPTDSTVLVVGETGTGKELVVRALHERSARRDRIMVKVACAALPEALLESEIFGHERGAFTGATAAKPGRLEIADGGTLFLDDVDTLSVGVQAKLLRAIEVGESQRLGSNTVRKVSTRVIAATNRDLLAEVRAGRFREDLYYRLHVVPIHLPPLRDRREDIPLLVEHLVAREGARIGRVVREIAASAMAEMQAWHWPGNVRELRNVVERALVLGEGPVLHRPGPMAAAGAGLVDQPAESMPPAAGIDSGSMRRAGAGTGSLADAVRDLKIVLIRDALARSSGNRTVAAESLGLHRQSLTRMIRDLDLREIAG